MDLREFGRFLKSRRDRIRPTDVGLLAGPRRRVPGLRRDEVANLAGASTDYYAELERGAAQPSDAMLTALARAMRLTRDERDHLCRLAGRAVPATLGSDDAWVDPAMLDVLDQLAGIPAQIMTDLHVVLVQNPLSVALIGRVDTTDTGFRAGFVYQWFTDPACRLLYPEADHAAQSEAFVADLRAVAARRGPDDVEAKTVVAELHDRSAEFSALWARHDVGVRRHDRKRVIHPDLGIVEINCVHLFSEDGRQRLLSFTPVLGTHAAEKFAMLRPTN